MVHPKEEMELLRVNKHAPQTVLAFLALGKDYLSDLPHDERERFLRGILARQEERDRWLLLLKYQNEYVGFVHMKIDKDERPGWGFILEFYIVPSKRGFAVGRNLFNLVREILQVRSVKHIWLLSDRASEQFWHKLGFRETGEIDKETGQEIMVTSI